MMNMQTLGVVGAVAFCALWAFGGDAAAWAAVNLALAIGAGALLPDA